MPLGIPHSTFLGWSDDDQDKALMYTAEMATVCRGCGTRQADWDEDPNAYIGNWRICPGCERLEEEDANIPDGTKGVHKELVPRPEEFKDQDEVEP